MRRDYRATAPCHPDYLRRRSLLSAVRDWRFWREAGRRFASLVAAGGILRHVVKIGVAFARRGTHRGYTVARAMLAQLSSTGAGYTVGLLGWTRIHVGHGGSRARLAYTTLPSHAFHAASRKHRRLAAAASSRNPYLYWECEENRHKGVHFAQQRVNGSGVVGYRSGQTQKDEISSINRRMKPTGHFCEPG